MDNAGNKIFGTVLVGGLFLLEFLRGYRHTGSIILGLVSIPWWVIIITIIYGVVILTDEEDE